MYGEVISNGGNNNPSFKVEITGLKQWAFDRHSPDQGIWVESRNAWYKLQQPSREKVTLSDGSQTSQEILHLPLRAKCGLISNIMDMMSVSGILQVEFLNYHAQRSPYQSCTDLCLTKEEKQMNPCMCDIPFDFYLLRRDPLFFKNELKGLDARFSQTCSFMKGLSQLSANLKNAKKNKEEWTLKDFDYLVSAQGAEYRSSRYPWGCPRLDVHSKYDSSSEISHNSNYVNTNLTNSLVYSFICLLQEKWTSKLEELVSFKLQSVKTLPPEIHQSDFAVDETSESVKESVKHKSKDRVNKYMRQSSSNSNSFHNLTNHVSDDSSHCSDAEYLEEKRQVKLEELSINTSNDGSSTEETHYKPLHGVAKQELNIIDLSNLFNKKNKRDAEIEVKKYLVPESNGIRETMLDKFIDNCINANDIHSFEYMIVYLEHLIKSSKKIKKDLFNRPSFENCAARTIFIRWLNKAGQIMKNNHLLDKREKHKSNSRRRSEDFVAEKIMELISTFDFLTGKTLKLINEKTELHLFNIIEKVR